MTKGGIAGGLSYITSVRRLSGVIAAITAICWGVVVESSIFTDAVQNVFAIFAFTLILWLTKAVPYVVSSTFTVVLLVVLGGAPSFRVAASGFASSLVFFLLLVFLLGIAIDKVNLDRWFASRLLADGSQSPRPIHSVAIHVFALAFVMPSAVARATTFVPIIEEMAASFGLEEGSDFERAAFLVLGHVNTIASMALMTAGGMALVTSEIIRTTVTPMGWAEWAVYMVPPVVVLYGLTAGAASRLYGPSSREHLEVDGGVSPDTGTLRTLDPEQRLVAVTMVGAVSLWIIGSFHGIPAIVPAALAVAVLTFPGVDILTADEMLDVSWGILFVVGAMFSLLNRMESVDALQFLVQSIGGAIPFYALTSWQSIGVLLLLAACIRAVFSTGSAAILVILPIVLRLGAGLGIDQLSLAFGVLLVVGSTTVFPFNTTAVLVTKEQGPLTTHDVVCFGLVTMVCSIFVVALSWVAYWPWIKSLF
ncbi:SLC13 family permease [Halobellus sp. EA9]|uniref:SLC13 family permease n=1 Tax=Halobellus sp. EA9 TaxID=3421647 RepID=UPI003EBC8B81